MVSLTLWYFYPMESSHSNVLNKKLDSRVSLDLIAKRKFLSVLGIEPWLPSP